ncbi:MAG TPA: hypothetical protein VLF20_06330, partial [Patescibacteria group bacterium]|nr:hypothetical protein [Patescibacteria group bacterium]
LVVGFSFSFPQQVVAQTENYIPLPSSQSPVKPNLAEDVPYDQHTYVQALFIELMLAVQCQLTGIDFTNPTHSCLGIDLTTGQLGYAPPEAYQQLPIGGAMGMLNHSLAAMFSPVAGSQEYVRYMSSNFGLVKPAMAAPATGFDGLLPVLGLWTATRDVAYFILIVAFIFIGIGVMLRLHIDPRTVMTVQNQIPRVIICIILITFSYALAGLMIDVMWTTTYMGINKLTDTTTGANSAIGCDGNKLSNAATENILENPFVFVNEVFMDPGCGTGGILDLSGHVGWSIAVIQTDLLSDFLFNGQNQCEIGGQGSNPVTRFLDALWDTVNPGHWILCGTQLGLQYWIRWISSVAWILTALIIVFISLFRIWISLLKAYAMTFLYVILGPLWIVMGLLPKKPLGFEKWIRVLFANLAVFPATAFLIVFARVLTDKFNGNVNDIYVPPLVGDPESGYLGGLIAFAILLATPSILDTLREKLGVPPSKAFQGAVQTFQAGRRAPGALGKKAWEGAYRVNPTTGAAESALAIGAQQVKGRFKRAVLGPTGILGPGVDPSKESGWKKFMRESDERKTNMRANRGYATNAELARGDHVTQELREHRERAAPEIDKLLKAGESRAYTEQEVKQLKGYKENELFSSEHEQKLAGQLGPSGRNGHEQLFLQGLSQQGYTLKEPPARATGTQQSGGGTSGGTGGNQPPQPISINLTIGGQRQHIPVTPGQTARAYLSKITLPTQRTAVLAAWDQQHGTNQHLSASSATEVQDLGQQDLARLESFVDARMQHMDQTQLASGGTGRPGGGTTGTTGTPRGTGGGTPPVPPPPPPPRTP